MTFRGNFLIWVTLNTQVITVQYIFGEAKSSENKTEIGFSKALWINRETAITPFVIFKSFEYFHDDDFIAIFDREQRSKVLKEALLLFLLLKKWRSKKCTKVAKNVTKVAKNVTKVAKIVTKVA